MCWASAAVDAGCSGLLLAKGELSPHDQRRMRQALFHATPARLGKKEMIHSRSSVIAVQKLLLCKRHGAAAASLSSTQLQLETFTEDVCFLTQNCTRRGQTGGGRAWRRRGRVCRGPENSERMPVDMTAVTPG